MKSLILGIALAGASVGASASSLAYELNGSYTYTPYCGTCSIDGQNGFPRYPGPTTLAWTGYVTVTVPDLADGTYRFEDVAAASFDVESNFANYSAPYGYDQPFTVVDDKLTNFSLTFVQYGAETTTVFATPDGGSARILEREPAPHHGDVFGGTAVLTPVPEPTTFALMGLGILVVGANRCRRKA